jgi:hypothetical protein
LPPKAKRLHLHLKQDQLEELGKVLVQKLGLIFPP